MTITARQLATILDANFDGWGDISPRSIEIVALGLAGDESIEDVEMRLDSIAMANALTGAATWINLMFAAPAQRDD